LPSLITEHDFHNKVDFPIIHFHHKQPRSALNYRVQKFSIRLERSIIFDNASLRKKSDQWLFQVTLHDSHHFLHHTKVIVSHALSYHDLFLQEHHFNKSTIPRHRIFTPYKECYLMRTNIFIFYACIDSSATRLHVALI